LLSAFRALSRARFMRVLDASLDDLIKSRNDGGGGAMRRPTGGKSRSRATPYSSRIDASQRDRGKFRNGEQQPKVGSGGDGTTVHVGNVPFTASWRELKVHFSSAGDVLRVEVAAKPDGSSRGFASVTFSNLRGARTATATLHESGFMGRSIVVREANGGGGGSGGGFKGTKSGGRVAGSEKKRFRSAAGASSSTIAADDGYSASGSVGKNGWVRPDHTKFVDTGPPPEPPQSRALDR